LDLFFNMRQIFLIISLFFFTSLLYAQEVSEKEYLVYLKDGSFLKGKVEEIGNSQIKVFIQASEPILISKKGVRRIEPMRDKYFFLENGLTFKNTRFFNAITLDAFISNISNNFGVHFTNAKFINPKMAIGLGVGIDLYTGSASRYYTYSFIPITAHFRNYIFNQKLSPYYAIDIGWGISGETNVEGYDNFYKSGLMGKLSIGLRFASRKKSNLVLETGYRFQKTYSEYETINYQNGSIIEIREDILFKRLTVGLGYIF